MDFLLGKVNFHGHVSLLEGIMFFPCMLNPLICQERMKNTPSDGSIKRLFEGLGCSGVCERDDKDRELELND